VIAETVSPDVAAAAERPPFISVIVPVRNEAAHLGETLRQLLNQHYETALFEVVVVDGESSDGTRQIVRDFQQQHANLRLYRNARKLSSAARNIGVCQAHGDVIVIVDGHCDLRNPNYLGDLAEAFQRSGADCLGRPQPLDVSGANLVQTAIAAARSSWLGHHPQSWVYSSGEQFVPPQSVAVAYRRSVFEKLGLFDESFDACEDVDFNHRVAEAGLRCFFTPKVRVYYRPRSNLSGLYQQMVRYARGRMRLLRKHPKTFSVACFVPMLFLLGLLTGPLLALFSPVLCSVYHLALILYAMLVVGASCQLAWQQRDFRLLPVLPLVYGAIHLGTGAGAMGEVLAWITRGEPKFILKTMPRPALVEMTRAPESDSSTLRVAFKER